MIPDWDVLKAMAQIAGIVSVNGIGAALMMFFAIRMRSATMAIAAVALGAVTFAIGYGVKKEKEVCEARFMAAERNFEDLQNEVGQLVGQVAARAKVALTEQERVNAEELRSIRVRLADSPVPACIANGRDRDDDLRLRVTPGRKGIPQG